MPLLNVEFCLTGNEVDLGDITAALNIEPTKTRLKKDWPNSTILAGLACDLWRLSTPQETCKSVSEQCKKLINQLIGKEEIIKQLCEKYNLYAHFEVVIHMQTMNGPEISLEREIVLFLASINADIGFDVYAY